MRWLSGLSMLKHLDLSYVNLSIGRLKSLSSLDVSLNKFQGSLPESMRRLTGLTELYLRSNEFKGLIPKWIGNLTALSQLQLSENKFTGLIPESVGHVTSLTSLDLSNNNFQGLIPHSIGNLTSLYFLNFFHNELRGGLPEEVCQLSKLESLSVDTNQLSGNIPECIGELSNLGSLFLSSNSWEGAVTERHFVNLTMLINLDIASNSNLTLNVSDNWVPPFQLQYIHIQSLEVGPKFPHWLLTQRDMKNIRMKNTSISRLNLSFNNLSGRIPTGNQLQTLEDPSIYAGNNQLCGQPILKPCTDDPDSHNAHI